MSTYRARRSMLAIVAAVAGLALSAPARADTVTQWNEIGANALIRDSGQGAVGIAQLAMVHGAMYDAVNAIDRGYQPYLVAPRARRWYSQDSAAATAAYRVLIDSRPPVVPPAQLPALVASLQPLYAASLAAIPDGRAKVGGIATGNAAADAMIAARTGDGRFGPFRFTAGTEIGQWRPEPPAFVSDPGAWLKDVKPFLIGDGSRFAARPPHALASRRYARDYDEVKALGALDSTVRTPDQTVAGRFWGAANAAGTWSALFRAIADGHPASLADHARLFARLYTTSADALITVWNDKARWSFWRPITAIHQGDQDGNPATAGDPGWMPLVATPPYPEHSSGLSAFALAATTTLEDFYGTDAATFGTTNAAGIARSFTSFSQAGNEIIDARVWAGIHFRFADEEGGRIGEQVARYAAHRFFGPAGREGHDDG
ncbi:MAG: phosphatase family protein [Conexibacter sp.]|nr:phosphatase family protein [Conexibacter sp.]